MIIDGVTVYGVDEKDARELVRVFGGKYPEIKRIDAYYDGDFINAHIRYGEGQPFERIRRITGYLVGTLDRFNDAKRAEERDRVKHA